ncbi:MAG: DUF2804 domain-containing protein [Polyangiaceae bacterium]|nr:DUF2804 domain-containing protein [Polyangiaceae bacterium]
MAQRPASAAGTEREIVAPVALCRADGSFDPAARGFSRGPLSACEVPGHWGRRKRWHYWGVTSPREIVSLTFVDLDYVGLAIAVVVDRASGRRFRGGALAPLGWRMPLPVRDGEGEVAVRRRRFGLSFRDLGREVALVVRAPGLAVDVTVTRPPGHETLGVGVGWDEQHFAYSAKHTALPARGSLALDGVRRRLAEGAFACLDFGRGVWPWRSAWNWASAAGVAGGRTLGLNLGARWTAGAGPSENALVVDGRIHKLPGELRFDLDRRAPRRPWRIEGRGVTLRFRPELCEHPRLPLGVLAAELVLGFGHFEGRVLDHDLTGLFGWAEDFRARW